MMMLVHMCVMYGCVMCEREMMMMMVPMCVMYGCVMYV